MHSRLLTLALSFLPILAFASDKKPHAGIAGHPDCKSYIGVIWFDGVDYVHDVYLFHYGLGEDQLKWWQKHAPKELPGVCYVPQTPAEAKANQIPICNSCPTNWERSSFWLSFSRDERSWIERRTGQSSSTETKDVPVTGTVTNEYGVAIGTISGTDTVTTTTTSTYPVDVMMSSNETIVAIFPPGNHGLTPPYRSPETVFSRMETKTQDFGGGIPTLISMTTASLTNLDKRALKHAVEFLAGPKQKK